MPTRHTRQHFRLSGFTIIEVLIVLAVVGLILLIIFLAVPALQRTSRNYSRKNYTGLIYGELNTYYDNEGHFPGAIGGNPLSATNRTEICNFLQSLPQVPAGTPCVIYTTTSSSVNGNIAAHCVAIQAGPYTVCYQDWENVSHGYIGPYDEISIMLAHWCNSGTSIDHSEPASYPVAGDDTNTQRFAIWTSLENSQTQYCLDNFPKT